MPGMSRSGQRQGSAHGCSHFYEERDPHDACPLCRPCHESSPCELCPVGEALGQAGITPRRSSSSRKRDSSSSYGRRRKQASSSVSVPVSVVPVSTGSSRDQGVVPPVQDVPGVGEGQPDPDVSRSRVELAGNARKLPCLPSGRDYQPPVSDVVSGSGIPGGVAVGGGLDAGPIRPSLGSGTTDFLSGLSVSTGISDAQLSNPGINAGPTFPPVQLPGPGPIRSAPECAGSVFPGGHPQVPGFVGQVSDFRPPFPPGLGYTGACGQPSLGPPNQPADGFGFQQHPGSYGPSPYMSGFPLGGSGGPTSSFGQSRLSPSPRVELRPLGRSPQLLWLGVRLLNATCWSLLRRVFPESVSFAGPFLPVGTSGPGNEEDMDCEVVGSAEDDDVVHLSPGCSDIDQSGLSDADPQVEDFQEEGDLEAAEVDAQQVLSGMRALRADVSRILGAEVCPPPSASSIPESTTLLGSLVAPRASAQSDRSLPEGTIVSSALATAQSRVMEKNSSSSRTPGFAGLQLSVGDLSEVQASDYAISRWTAVLSAS
ncbi:uncharacterized protein [Argopecten irradians]|uniref:uncharacterized protein n=1 Tax=Argopecten irradians TaxID=31199 RepID=UPI0037192129